MTMTGSVTLVGAGPGDPDLLTVRAVSCLRSAELLLYDALVTPAIIALAPQAQRFCVGKRAGRRSVSQDTIHRLMIRGARRGKRVVRLKNGDPFVLGRGGEELQALLDAGVPAEVVPGVTSAIAAPAALGVPVTHRGLASGFVVVSGHAETAYGPILDTVAPHTVTVVVLMGMAHRAAIAERMIARGWLSQTPAAVVLAAGGPGMRVWQGRLADLGDAVIDTSDGAPGTIVVGDVVGLSARTARGATRATTPIVLNQQRGVR